MAIARLVRLHGRSKAIAPLVAGLQRQYLLELGTTQAALSTQASSPPSITFPILATVPPSSFSLPPSPQAFLRPRHGSFFFSSSQRHQAQPCGSKGGAPPSSDKSPDSDDDFKPQYKKAEELSPIHKLIDEDVRSTPVMVYMKGVPAAPMCGFSNGVVQLLKAYGVDFKSRNVLEDPELRQGIKTYSQWPTIPQVFVNGEFVGGCDILFKMHESGELEDLFAKVKTSATA